MPAAFRAHASPGWAGVAVRERQAGQGQAPESDPPASWEAAIGDTLSRRLAKIVAAQGKAGGRRAAPMPIFSGGEPDSTAVLSRLANLHHFQTEEKSVTVKTSAMALTVEQASDAPRP